MHDPPEVVGLALHQSTLSYPVDDWGVIIANQEACDVGVRYIKHNLAMSFDKADINSGD